MLNWRNGTKISLLSKEDYILDFNGNSCVGKKLCLLNNVNQDQNLVRVYVLRLD